MRDRTISLTNKWRIKKQKQNTIIFLLHLCCSDEDVEEGMDYREKVEQNQIKLRPIKVDDDVGIHTRIRTHKWHLIGMEFHSYSRKNEMRCYNNDNEHKTIRFNA